MTMHREPETWREQLRAMGFNETDITRAAAAGVTDVTSAIDHITSNPVTDSSDKHARSTALIPAPPSPDHFPPMVQSASSRPSGLTNARNSLDRIPRTPNSASHSNNNNSSNNQNNARPRGSARDDAPMTPLAAAAAAAAHGDDDLTRVLALSRKEEDDREMARAIHISKQHEAAARERDPQLMQALQESLHYNNRGPADRNVSWQSHAFASPPERVRHSVDDPVGLRNVGNTCYLNSLLQVYFHLAPFRRAVMSYRPRDHLIQPAQQQQQQQQQQQLGSAPPAAGTTAMSGDVTGPALATTAPAAARRDGDDDRKSDTTADVKQSPPSDVDMTPAVSSAAPPRSANANHDAAPPNDRLAAAGVADTATAEFLTAAATGRPVSSPPQQPQNSPAGDHASDKSDNRSDARSAGATRNAVAFVVELQKLFAAMALGNQNCADPTAVLRAMRDPDGKPIEIGDQQDASEFNHLFLDIVEKGLQAESAAASTPAPSLSAATATDHCKDIDPAPAASGTNAINIVKDLFTVKFRQEVRSCPPPTNSADPRDEDMAPIVTDGETNCIIVDATSRDGRTLHNGLDDYAVAKIDYKVQSSSDSDAKNSNTTSATSPTKMDIARPGDGATDGEEAKSNGEVSLARPAMKRVWFSKLPPVMVIYLQRVRFNREKALAEKVHSKYEFGTDISFDRYLEENREVSAQARERVLGIRKERKRLLSVVKKYRYFPDGIRDRPVDSSADNERADVADGGDEDEQMGEGTYFQAVDRIQERLRHAMQPATGGSHEAPADVGRDELETAQNVLQRIVESDRKQCEAVERSLASLEDEREAYRHMEKAKYGLHAVLVHDGAPSSGHYWAFIRDCQASQTAEKTWVKFSDSAVVRVSESDVLRWSLGGSGTASAYCLMYTGPTVAAGSEPKADCNIAEESRKLLPQVRLDEVEAAALAFNQELEQSRAKVEEQRPPQETQQW